MTSKIALLAAGFALVSTAASATVVDDTSLSTTSTPGVYFGSGNTNSGFTVDTEGSVEIGLSAVTRFIGPITPVGDVYSAPTGNTAVSGKTGSDWGFDFSVNLNADGEGSRNLSNITTRLTMTDVAAGTTDSFDVLLGGIPDNTLYGASGPCALPNASCTLANFYAFQNSETLSFNSIAAALGDAYNVNANDTYIFTLQVFSKSSDTPTQLGTDQIQVKVGTGAPVPEPITLTLFGAGLVGASFIRRRKSSKA